MTVARRCHLDIDCTNFVVAAVAVGMDMALPFVLGHLRCMGKIRWECSQPYLDSMDRVGLDFAFGLMTTIAGQNLVLDYHLHYYLNGLVFGSELLVWLPGYPLEVDQLGMEVHSKATWKWQSKDRMQDCRIGRIAHR